MAELGRRENIEELMRQLSTLSPELREQVFAGVNNVILNNLQINLMYHRY